jgi:hypothetical protein
MGDFSMADPKALDAFLQLRESNRYIGGMFSGQYMARIYDDALRPAK